MPKTTKKYGFIQPEVYENYDIQVQNQNMSRIEEELSKRKEYDPDEMSAEDVLKASVKYTDEKIKELIGTAPEALDTIYELASAIKDNEDLLEIIKKAVEESAKKEELTAHENDETVHVTEQERKSWNDSNSKKHDHDNKSILDIITQSLVTAWNDAVDHITDGIRHVTSQDKELWNKVSDKADADSVPTKVSELENDSNYLTGEKIEEFGYTSNTGTLTEIKMNGESKGTSGVVDLGTILTGGEQTMVSADDGGSNVYTFSDGSTIIVKNGSKGSKGDTGSAGTDGAAGTRGSVINSGTAITGTSTTATAFSGSGLASSMVNDLYINTSTFNVYKCTVAGNAATAKWVYVGCIKGATGSNGTNATTTAVASTSANGLMSKEDKVKLNNIETKMKTAVFFVKK